MDLLRLFTLSLCWWAAATSTLSGEKPSIIISEHEILNGQSVKVTCSLPIEAGKCRLYKDKAHEPFKEMFTTDRNCVFHVTSRELLGPNESFGQIYLKCDFQLQEHMSESSDITGLRIRSRMPRPKLLVSRRFMSPEDSVEVLCNKPLCDYGDCFYFRDDVRVAEASCATNLTGEQLAMWAEPSLLLPVNLTCTYPRSYPSNHEMLFVVDASRAASSVDCKVSVDDDQLPAFRNNSWTSVGANGLTVNVQVTNSNLKINETCNPIQTQT